MCFDMTYKINMLKYMQSLEVERPSLLFYTLKDNTEDINLWSARGCKSVLSFCH